MEVEEREMKRGALRSKEKEEEVLEEDGGPACGGEKDMEEEVLGEDE